MSVYFRGFGEDMVFTEGLDFTTPEFSPPPPPPAADPATYSALERADNAIEQENYARQAQSQQDAAALQAKLNAGETQRAAAAQSGYPVSQPAVDSGGSSWFTGLSSLFGSNIFGQPTQNQYRPSTPTSATPAWVIPAAIGGGVLVLAVIAMSMSRRGPAVAGYKRKKRKSTPRRSR